MPSLTDTLSKWIKSVIVLALAGSAVLLLAFGPRASDQFPKDAVVVDYWEKWTGFEEAGMRRIVDDFNSTVGRDKHIFVRYLSTSAIEQKTLVATSGGTPPDVAGLYNQDIPQFAAMNALEPLDDVSASRGITADYYKKVFWDECRYNGRLYGLVSSAYDIGLYYNKQIFQSRADVLRARGLDPSRPPRSIAELDAYAKALDVISPGGHIDIAGYLPMEPGWYLNYTPIWFGGSWWNNQTHQFTFMKLPVIRAFQWVQSYSQRLGNGAVSEFRSGLGAFDSPQNSFLAGQMAMEQQGTFFANFILKHNPDLQWGAAPFPSDDPNLRDVTYCNCDVLVIPRGSRHQREAFEFIAFVNRQDEMEKLAKLHCKISPLAKVSPDFLTNHPNPYVAMFDKLAASPNAHPTEPVPILNEVQDEMNDFVQRLALLQDTPQNGLQEIQSRLQQKYDDFMEDQRKRSLLAAGAAAPVNQ